MTPRLIGFIIMLYEEFEPAVEMINRFKRELEQTNISPIAELVKTTK